MKTKFTVKIDGIGEIDVVRQNDGEDTFYDLFDETGCCLNEGSPYWTLPTRREVVQVLLDEFDRNNP